MIIDAHAHLGFDEVFDHDFTEADLVAGQEANGIAASLVQPGTCHALEGVRRQHDAIADLGSRQPGRFFGIANPNPHLPAREYDAEVRRCVEGMGFLGVKIHPAAHAMNPLGRAAGHVFALAREMGLPVMVHTGAGIPWAAPSLLGPVAAAHADLKIVAAHAGMMVLAGEAGILAAEHANVYLECSWTPGFKVAGWVKSLGPQRVLFGSDHAENAATELAKFRTCGLSEEELDWTLGRAAAAVFNLPAGGCCLA
jgi:hypothetical protein